MPLFERLKRYVLEKGGDESNLNQLMKRKQNRIGLCVLVVLIVVTVVLYHLSQKESRRVVPLKEKQVIAMDGVLSTDFTQKNELSALEQEQERMDQLRKELARLQQTTKENKQNQSKNKVALLKAMHAILAKREVQQPAAHSVQEGSTWSIPFSHVGVGHLKGDVDRGGLSSLETIRFYYDAAKRVKTAGDRFRGHKGDHAKTPRTYVPAGTFARGVLLEGADANASVNGQSDTVGILVRILDNGTIPNGHHSHLKGCFVLASMYGDISSERGEARLTRLSCTRSDGTILERKVQGYLSFAGKEGIKGIPVMRNGKILVMAGISGMLSGFGSALQQSIRTQSISPFGTTSTVNSNKVWQNGVYGGVGTAMNQLANYYIKRADQYHPIIEIGSGTVATVIFQSGFSLVDDDQVVNTREDNPVATSTDRAQEIKTLLKEAHSLSGVKTTAPFSQVN